MAAPIDSYSTEIESFTILKEIIEVLAECSRTNRSNHISKQPIPHKVYNENILNIDIFRSKPDEYREYLARCYRCKLIG